MIPVSGDSNRLFTRYTDTTLTVGQNLIAFRNLIQDFGIDRLAQHLEDSNIFSLDLHRYCSFRSEQIDALVETLKKRRVFVELDMHSCKIRGLSMPILVQGFTHLQKINLNGNRLGDMGARILAEFLATNPPLTHLLVQDNCIGIQGGEDFGQALAHNHRLRELDLFQNQLESAGALKVMKGLVCNSSLTRLNFEENGVEKKDNPQILLLLAKNHSLTRFNNVDIDPQERLNIVTYLTSQTMAD